jgi:drug/metabolite transporter (DMT)-like permease
MTASDLRRYDRDGIVAALISATLLGLAPIFGKQALQAGIDYRVLVTIRTVSAALILWLFFILVWRRYLFIYPVGLTACATAGIINGLGSVFYYSGLNKLDASLAQLIYSINPLILIVLLRLDGQPISRLTVLRLLLALPAIYFLTTGGDFHEARLKGVAYMLIGGLGYALHLAIIQRPLRDMPPPTVTLYSLTAMAFTVAPVGVWALWARPGPQLIPDRAWAGVAGLTIVTAISRLSLFVGVKKLGGLQAALLGLSELIVSVFTALIFFGERLTFQQWMGAAALALSIGLVSRERDIAGHYMSYGWLAWMYALLERFTPQPKPPEPAKVKKVITEEK